jgi:hypothetical protein
MTESANTVLHNVIIIAQFCKRNGRSGITRQVHLPERISSLPREYTQEELSKFLATCNDSEVALFSTFLLTGFREQDLRPAARLPAVGYFEISTWVLVCACRTATAFLPAVSASFAR